MIINKLGNSKDIFSNKVYEGTIPSNYIEISTFIHAEKINEVAIPPLISLGNALKT